MAKRVDFEKVKKEVKGLIADIAELSEEEIKEDASFTEDLGIDSMMALEIVAKIEKKYKVPIPEQRIPTITSLSSVYELLEELLKK